MEPDYSRIKLLCKERGITLIELSKLSGVPYDTLTKITRGTTKAPSYETMHAIAHALGITSDTLALRIGFTNHIPSALANDANDEEVTAQILNIFKYLDEEKQARALSMLQAAFPEIKGTTAKDTPSSPRPSEQSNSK